MAVVTFRGANSAPKSAKSSMDTLILSLDQVNQWKIPPFQRPVRINAKVEAIANEIKCDGVSISGILTLGKLTSDSALYVVDGQHRVEAFRQSGLEEVIADVRIMHFDTMAEMADEFVKLNTAIVRMRPDDLLRGLTPTYNTLQRIMRECPFVGFDNVRRGGTSSAIVSLAQVIRCWYTSGHEAPSSSGHGMGIGAIAHQISEQDSVTLVRFLKLCHDAWGRDPEFYRLWGSANLALCMWLYRRVVLDTTRRGNMRIVVLTDSQFRQCLTALTASGSYLDFLVGRLLNDRDRSPVYVRIKQIFVRKLSESTPNKVNLPSPAWSSR